MTFLIIKTNNVQGALTGVMMMMLMLMYLFTTVPHPHGHWQLQELLGNQIIIAETKTLIADHNPLFRPKARALICIVLMFSKSTVLITSFKHVYSSLGI